MTGWALDLGTTNTESLDIPAGMAELINQHRHDLIEAVVGLAPNIFYGTGLAPASFTASAF